MGRPNNNYVLIWIVDNAWLMLYHKLSVAVIEEPEKQTMITFLCISTHLEWEYTRIPILGILQQYLRLLNPIDTSKTVSITVLS